MDVERKIELVRRRPAAEVITEEELRALFETNAHPKHYIGFEISGMVHLGTGLVSALKINDLIEAGVRPTIFLADYHAWLNGKLGGDLEKIQKVAKGYFKHAFISLGLDEARVGYILASESYDDDYWKNVLGVAKDTTLKRMLRCTTIMGRKESEANDAASILYPAMQTADIFKLDVDIAHAGMDQRKVHVLAREMADKWKRKKPIALHARLLMGLQGPQKMGMDESAKADVEISSKMSKSKPESCIYIHDSEEEIKKKIGKAHCPPKVVEENPIVEICEYILMRDENARMKIEREKKYGGDVEFNLSELKMEYASGSLHPMDLKNAVARELAKVLTPSREYFAKHSEFAWPGDAGE